MVISDRLILGHIVPTPNVEHRITSHPFSLHGAFRDLVHESRILQVTVFGTLQSNLNSSDFSVLLPDVMTIADEVDAQLTQSMESYVQAKRKSAAA
jgi:hypothetical protein